MCCKSSDGSEALTNINTAPATDDDENDNEGTGTTTEQENITATVVGDECTNVRPDHHLSEEDTEQESPSSVQTQADHPVGATMTTTGADEPVVLVEGGKEDDNFQNNEEAATEDTEPSSLTFCTREALVHPAETVHDGGVNSTIEG